MTKEQYQAAFEAIEKAAKNNQISWPGALERVSLLALEYERAQTDTEAKVLVADLVKHLDYCGWGDSWERECSEDLRKRVDDLPYVKKARRG